MEALAAVLALIGIFGGVVYGYANQHKKNGSLNRENEELKAQLIHAKNQIERTNAPDPTWGDITDAAERMFDDA